MALIWNANTRQYFDTATQQPVGQANQAYNSDPAAVLAMLQPNPASYVLPPPGSAPAPASPAGNAPPQAAVPGSPRDQLSTPQRANMATSANPSDLPRLIVQDSNGRVNTAMLDGSDPRQFSTWNDFKSYIQQSGESYIGDQSGSKNAITEDQAIKMAREWTGDQSYNGAKGLTSMAQYRPPTVQNGSPAARGVDINDWLPTAKSNPFGKGYQATPPLPPPTDKPLPVEPPPPPGPDPSPPPPYAPPPGPAPAPGPALPPGMTPPIPLPSGGGMPPTSAVNPPTSGGTGNFTNSTTPPTNWQDLLRYLTSAGLNRSLGSNNLIDLATQQLSNAQNRTNAIDTQQGTVSNFINSMINQANSYSSFKDQGIQTILHDVGTTGPGGLLASAGNLLDSTLKQSATPPTLAEQPGFSPQGQAAMRLQQSEVIPHQFNDALSGAYAELQRRGALGGELPGSAEDLMRTLAPIYAARGTAYSQLNSQNILENEQLKNQQYENAVQTMLSNRGLAGKTMDSLYGLTGTLGNLYNPAQFSQLASGGIGNLVNLINAGTGALETGNQAVNAATGAYSAGNQPLQTAATTGGALASNDPGSLSRLLLGALLGTAGGQAAAGSQSILGQVFSKIPWGTIFKGKTSGGGTDTTGSNDYASALNDWFNQGTPGMDWNSIYASIGGTGGNPYVNKIRDGLGLPPVGATSAGNVPVLGTPTQFPSGAGQYPGDTLGG